MAELVFHRRGEELMRVLLDRPTTILGRGAGADVAIPHPEVSRRQAAIERVGETFRLVDLSGRGTRLASSVVEEALLEEGDRLHFGDFVARFSHGSPPTDETRTGREATREVQGPPPPPRGELRLRIRCRDDEILLPLEGDSLVGTDRSCTIVLDDPFASGLHCRITSEGGHFAVTDLGSTNGTWVDGVRVGQAALSPGSWIRVGRSDLLVEKARRQEGILFEGMLTQSAALMEVFELVERVAPSLAPVAIFGETGTGKELVARALHSRSERAQGPFIPVNCAAISKELVESELFGHERGAFTGALATRKGAFEEAHGGTLFLDEIGELPIDLQAKLLRALELGEIRRVGASRPFRADVRIVAATHRDLRAMARQGTFREDLYYRLSVIRVELPPLRERQGDLPLLAGHLLRHHAPKGPVPSLAPAALARLAAHPWPGNVRELRNVLARALLLRKGHQIQGEDLYFDGEESRQGPIPDDDEAFLLLPGRTLAEVEREAILKSLRRHKGNRRAAARELGLARSTLQLRAKELGVPPPADYED